MQSSQNNFDSPSPANEPSQELCYRLEFSEVFTIQNQLKKNESLKYLSCHLTDFSPACLFSNTCTKKLFYQGVTNSVQNLSMLTNLITLSLLGCAESPKYIQLCIMNHLLKTYQNTKVFIINLKPLNEVQNSPNCLKL